MLQFYFLSVLLNLITGFVLAFSNKQESSAKDVIATDSADTANTADTTGSAESDTASEQKDTSALSDFFNSNSVFKSQLFLLVLGLLSAFTGLIKLLSAVNGIALLGDLIPAVCGIAGGICLLCDYYASKSTSALELPPVLSLIFGEFRTYLGYACILAAVIHFLLPGALFL